jgi:XTP/dITP diphosphohydrolase
VWTADWAERQWFEGEPGRDWYMAMGKVEGMLQAKGAATSRDAWFTCVLALTWPDGEHAVTKARPKDRLSGRRAGQWASATIRCSFRAGTTGRCRARSGEKHRISHRADAFARLVADQFVA